MADFTLPIISAFLSIFSFPVALGGEPLLSPAFSSTISLIALIPLILTCRTADPGESFRRAFVYGIVANLGILFWISVAIRKYGHLPFGAAASMLLAVVTILALYPAIALALAARLRDRIPYPFVAASLFTFLEWTRVYMPLGGFPWAAPAYSLYGFPTLIQAADLFGTPGLNFIVYLTNFLLAEAIISYREIGRLPRRSLALCASLLITLFIYGTIRKHQFSRPPSTPALRVALLQGNIPQDQKWSPGGVQNTLNIYRGLTGQAIISQPDLIVWPEAALPFPLPREIEAIGLIPTGSFDGDFVVGAPSFKRVDDKSVFRNSAFVVGPDQGVRMRYDKRHLVPFGEYVPLSKILPMDKVVPAVAGNFEEGEPPELANIRGHAYGIIICYEVVFPDLSLDLARKGATFIVNITNDAWYDRTSGPYQHANFGIFRAIETRKPIVRAANTGVTAWYDADGSMHDATTLFTTAIVLADIHPREGVTFYVRHPFFLVGLLFVSLVVVGVTYNP